MKTAVDKVFVSKYDRKFNQNFLCMLKHYIIDPTACNPASGWEKGQVALLLKDLMLVCKLEKESGILNLC